jgi:hypothetical protein
MWKAFVVVAILVALVSGSKIDKCKKNIKKGDVCSINIDDARPTQHLYGRIAAMCKQQRFESYSKHDLEKYLEKHPVPVVIGPDGGFYITDHHHLLRALHDAKIDKDWKTVIVNVVDNFDKMSMNQFWDTMVKKNYAYLKNSKGVFTTNGLPTHVKNLTNEPFRSLSFISRRYGGYSKDDPVFFMEFIWADYYRNIRALQPLSITAAKDYREELNEVRGVLKGTLSVSHAAAAAKLPGFIPTPGQLDLPGCEIIDRLVNDL